ERYRDFHGVHRAFELAWAHSQVQVQHLRLSGEEVYLYQRLAGSIFYAGPKLRNAEAIAGNQQGQPALWRHGISGDKPIVLARIAVMEEVALVRQLLAAHSYWRLKGLEVDLVLLNEQQTGYFEELHQELQNLVRGSDDRALLDKPGGVFVRKAALIPKEDQILLQAAARCVLNGNRGSLASQLDGLGLPPRTREGRRRAPTTERPRRREEPLPPLWHSRETVPQEG